MKISAAQAIANYITPTADYILPSPLDKNVATAVAKGVSQ
jgi:malic enzyme